LLGLVLCELGLRAAGHLYLYRGGRGADSADVPGLTILCAGDSNTFGLHVEAHEAYPARLEALISAREPGGPHRVVNAGVPGFPSRRVRAAVEEGLTHHRPDVVLVLAGVNNLWDGAPPGAEAGRLRTWFEDLRLVRLVRLAGEERALPDGYSAFTDRDGVRHEVALASAERAVAAPAAQRALSDDVAAMRAAALAAGARLVLVAYAEDERISGTRYGLVNAWLREIAAEQDLPLVDTAATLTPLLPEVGRHVAFPFRDDPHPGPVGYELVARCVHDRLVALGVLRAEPVGALADGLESAVALRPDLSLSGALGAAPGAPDEPTLAIAGAEPGRPFQVLLSDPAPGAPRAHLGTRLLPLAESALLTASSRTPALQGRIDARGEARCALGELLRSIPPGALAGRTLRACYVLFESEDDPSVRYVSGAVDLVLE
jgi:lysophospholipase L1-like esterase